MSSFPPESPELNAYTKGMANGHALAEARIADLEAENKRLQERLAARVREHEDHVEKLKRGNAAIDVVRMKERTRAFAAEQELADARAERCPVPGDVSWDYACNYNPVSSRTCEMGTNGCVARHDPRLRELRRNLTEARAEIERLRAALGPCPRCDGKGRFWFGCDSCAHECPHDRTCFFCNGTGVHPALRGASEQEERRASVQGDYKRGGKPPGTIAWSEHVEAFEKYAKRYGREQNVERINERGGFGFGELIQLLGHEPTTWRPR